MLPTLNTLKGLGISLFVIILISIYIQVCSGRPVMAKHSTFASREEQGVHPSCVALLAATLNRIRRAIALSEGPRATDSVRSFGLQRNMFASFISPVCSQARNKAKIPFNVCSRLVRTRTGITRGFAYDYKTNTLRRCVSVW